MSRNIHCLREKIMAQPRKVKHNTSTGKLVFDGYNNSTFLTPLQGARSVNKKSSGSRGVVGPVDLVVLPAFSYQSETVAYTAAWASTPADRRKYTIDRAIRKLKAKPTLYSKIKGAWLTIGGAKLVNIVNPSMIATPGSTAVTDIDNIGISGDNTISTAGIRTGFIPSANLSQNNNHFGVFIQEPISQSNGGAAGGCISAGSGRFLISPKDSSASGGATGGCNSSATVTLMSSSSNNSGRGFYLLSRDNASTIAVYRNQRLVNAALASPSGSLPTTDISINGFNNSGTVGSGCYGVIGYVTIGDALTQSEYLDYYAIVRTLLDEIRSGEPTFFDTGFAIPNTYWDAVVFGATPSGIGAAIELKRQGKNVCIVGQMFERHLGGVMSGGLGKTDLVNSAGVAGIWSAVKYRANQFGAGGNNDYAEPRQFEWTFRRLLDPLRGGLDVPIFWSDGIESVTKQARRDWKVRTRDGHSFRTKLFLDQSYEMDLGAKVPGITYTIGREAAGTGKEAQAGWKPAQLTNSASQVINVDPFIEAGNPASGFMPPIIDGSGIPDGTGDIATYRNGVKISGSANPYIQAFNFRITVTTQVYDKVPWAQPSGYTESDYELLARTLAAATASGNSLVFDTNLTTIVPVGSTSDLNNGGYVSTDYVGYSHGYIEADYETRKAIRAAHKKYDKGFVYFMANTSDSRVTAGNKALAGNYGMDGKHYLDPIPEDGDDYFWPYTLYVREGRHIVGPLKWDANDIAATDGTSPRSTNIIATASYGMDSHQVNRLARNIGGVWKVFAEGGMYDGSAGGTDNISPLPMEIFMPVKSECEDLLVSFGASMTHLAFASARMEPTMIAIGQGLGAVAAEALDSDVAVQDVNYSNVRARLLASPSLPGETAPVLPQVN